MLPQRYFLLPNVVCEGPSPIKSGWRPVRYHSGSQVFFMNGDLHACLCRDQSAVWHSFEQYCCCVSGLNRAMKMGYLATKDERERRKTYLNQVAAITSAPSMCLTWYLLAVGTKQRITESRQIRNINCHFVSKVARGVAVRSERLVALRDLCI